MKDEQVISALANTGDRLSSAIDATAFLAQQHKGTGAAVDAAFNIVDHTSSIVKEELQLAANIATVVGRKVLEEADALTALDERAMGAIAAVRAAESSILESSSGNGDLNMLSQLTSELTKDARAILRDVDITERLAMKMSNDVAANGEVMGALARASSDVQSLLVAVDAALHAAGDVVAVADEATTQRVIKAVRKIEESARGVEGSLEEVKNTKELIANMEEASKLVSLEPVKETINKKQGEAMIRIGDEKERGQIIADVKEISPPSEIDHEKVGPLVKIDSPRDDAIREVTAEDTIFMSSREDVKHFEKYYFEGESGRELPDATTTIASDHGFDGESVNDVTLSIVDKTSHLIDIGTNSMSSDHLTEAVVTNGDPGGFASDLGLSIPSSSEAAHDVVTSTAEMLAEAMVSVSSLFL